MESLIGNTFVDGKGKTFTFSDVVKPTTKAVALYFSAHWCPPCRGFTPQLAQMYLKNLKALGLEVIFVSSDKGETEFKEYLREQPWFALPFSDRDRKNRLSSKFKVQGIPSLVLLTPEGKLITDQGRSVVMKDPTGVNFPWLPKSPLEVLGTAKFVANGGRKVENFASLQADVVGLYFSASWCGPCQGFTPKLKETYAKLKQDKKSVEIIFISSDNDQASFDKYFGTMPWVALDFRLQDIQVELNEIFKVEGIPTLIMLDTKTGEVYNTDTVGEVVQDPLGVNFPWAPQPCQVLTGANASSIGSSVAVFIFGNPQELQPTYSGAVNVWRGKQEEGSVCTGEVCVPTGGKLEGADDILFFIADRDPIAERVKELSKAGSNPVVILDLGRQVYAHSSILGNPTPRAVRQFVSDYLNGKVLAKPLGA